MGTAINTNAVNKTFHGGCKALQDIHLNIQAADMSQTRAGVGFVFQHFNLVDRLPAIANVLAGRI